MKHIGIFLASLLTVALVSCKSSFTAPTQGESLEETLEQKNRQTVPLLNRIRKLPGISLRNGIPVFGKKNNTVETYGEPLYILDNYPVGNSFRSVNGIVESVNVKKVEALTAADASFYGSRASNGVIKITTYQ